MSLGETNPWLPKGIPPPVSPAFLLLSSEIQEVTFISFQLSLSPFLIQRPAERKSKPPHTENSSSEKQALHPVLVLHSTPLPVQEAGAQLPNPSPNLVSSFAEYRFSSTFSSPVQYKTRIVIKKGKLVKCRGRGSGEKA